MMPSQHWLTISLVALMDRVQCVRDTTYLLYQKTKDKSGYG